MLCISAIIARNTASPPKGIELSSQQPDCDLNVVGSELIVKENDCYGHAYVGMVIKENAAIYFASRQPPKIQFLGWARFASFPEGFRPQTCPVLSEQA